LESRRYVGFGEPARSVGFVCLSHEELRQRIYRDHDKQGTKIGEIAGHGGSVMGEGIGVEWRVARAGKRD
jgi:hypothetical protein